MAEDTTTSQKLRTINNSCQEALTMDRSILLVNPIDIQEPNYIESKNLLADNAGPTTQLLQNYCDCYLSGNGHQIQYFLKAAYCEVQCSSSVVWGQEHKLLLIIKASCSTTDSSAEAEKRFFIKSNGHTIHLLLNRSHISRGNGQDADLYS